MAEILADAGLTFDDLLLVPRRSDVVPKDVDVASRLTRRIDLLHLDRQLEVVGRVLHQTDLGQVVVP